MKKMTKNENNDSFMRDKNIVQAVDSKRKSHSVRPNGKAPISRHTHKRLFASWRPLRQNERQLVNRVLIVIYL